MKRKGKGLLKGKGKVMKGKGKGHKGKVMKGKGLQVALTTTQ